MYTSAKLLLLGEDWTSDPVSRTLGFGLRVFTNGQLTINVPLLSQYLTLVFIGCISATSLRGFLKTMSTAGLLLAKSCMITTISQCLHHSHISKYCLLNWKGWDVKLLPSAMLPAYLPTCRHSFLPSFFRNTSQNWTSTHANMSFAQSSIIPQYV